MIDIDALTKKYDLDALNSWISTLQLKPSPPEPGDTRLALSCIDLTSLDGNDNILSISGLCNKALTLAEKGGRAPAAVCVYPNFITLTRNLLKGSGIKSACVAGGFPSAQGMSAAKAAEIRMAREEGADEIDTVFPRGYLCAGEWSQLTEELAMMREAAGNTTLKIILETGELKDPKHIALASLLSLHAGADFIKTSTGKSATGFTKEAFLIMLNVILQVVKLDGRKAGIKASGGVAEPETAYWCLSVLRQLAGNDFLKPGLFRIGASRLADKLIG